MAVFLTTTTPGLYLVFKIAGYFLPGDLHVEKLEGRLIDHFSLARLYYHDEKLSLNLKNLSLTWQSKSLRHHQILFKNLSVEQLQVDGEKTKFALPRWPFNISIENVSVIDAQIIQGNSTHKIKNLKLKADLTNRQWQIRQLNFDFNAVHVTGELIGQPVIPYALTAQFQFRNRLLSEPKISANLNIGGDFFLYHWRGEIKSPGSLVLNGTLKEGSELHTQVQWALDKIPPHPILSHKGRGKKINSLPQRAREKITSPLVGEVDARSAAGEGKSRTFYEGQMKIDGNLPNLSINLNSKIPSPLHSILKLKAQTFAHGVRAEGEMTLPEGQLQFNANYDATITPHLKGKLNGEMAALRESTLTIKALKFAAQFSGNSLTDLQLNSHLTAQYLNNAFADGNLHASLSSQDLNLKGTLTLDNNKKLNIAFKLPQFTLLTGLSATQALQGDVRLDVHSLEFLQSISTEIAHPQGHLQASLNVTGTVKNPIIEGKLTLHDGKVSIPHWGIDLHSINLDLQSRNKRWQAHGILSSNAQTLNLKGQGAFSPRVTGSIHVDGDNFPLINIPEYVINVSPKLLVEFNPDSLIVKGNVVVPQAKIKLQSFTNSESLSDDVVFEGHQRIINPLHINSDIHLEMGNDVSIDVKGLKGLLAGSIHLHQLPDEPLNATGELTIRNGKYQAYGQDLTIEQGQLFFTGPRISDPGVRIRAVRQINNSSMSFANTAQLFDFNNTNLQASNLGDKTTVGIEMTGRLNSPKLELFSNPSIFSQADILSMLLLGRPASQASKSGGQLLLAAISSMNLDTGTKGTQLMEQLKHALGVDINVESTPKYDEATNQVTDRTSVVVGKSLSKRLYVSYNFGLAQTDSNVVTLTYLLNKFFSLQVNSSITGSGIDLLYTHRKE
ncbi:translocation/assembly module TamB domain-containing protein [Legionella lansingensis]|nr:translocation/assembly module TamB domain-containing protein [Legionella lansingensis]